MAGAQEAETLEVDGAQEADGTLETKPLETAVLEASPFLNWLPCGGYNRTALSSYRQS